MSHAVGRFKDSTWDLSNGAGRCADWQRAQIAVLMDIRDELKSINRVLGCGNFLDIPFKLDSINKNTKPKKKRKVAAQRKG